MLIGVVFSALDFTLKITIYYDSFWFSLRQAFLFPQNFLICSDLFISPKFLIFQFYLDFLIHSRINSKLYQYVFTLSALDPRVYILAYDFDLHSVLVLLNASLTSV